MTQTKQTKDTAEIRVGVIGTGAIGTDHIRRIMEKTRGAAVTAVYDYVRENAQLVADNYDLKVFDQGEELIRSNKIDAVVIASSDESHAHYVRECIRAGKQVLCEKPLASTVEDCISILDLEKAAGRRFVQVGFMRRYDSGYMKLKQIIDSNELGALLMIRAAHRNKTHAINHTTDMSIKNSGIHEIDIIRWLTGEEYTEGMALTARQNSTTDPAIQDPQLLVIRSKSGITSEVEINMNSGYGYDIRCEIVCEKGVAQLTDPHDVILLKDAFHGHSVLTDWSQRFIAAYDEEFQDWIDSVHHKKAVGASAWDGYVAQAVAEALIGARDSGRFERFMLTEKPPLYDQVKG